jgi:hypothetical protein
MRDIKEIADTYFSLWSEPNPERRREAVAAVFTEGATFTGPIVEVKGHDGITGFANQILEHLSGHQFNRTRDVDTHHDVVRWAWEITPGPNQPVFATGVDVCRIAPDGRLASLTTFLDVAPDFQRHHETPANPWRP